MKLKNNQQGIAHLLLIFVAAALLSLVGFIVVRALRSESGNQQSNSASQADTIASESAKSSVGTIESLKSDFQGASLSVEDVENAILSITPDGKTYAVSFSPELLISFSGYSAHGYDGDLKMIQTVFNANSMKLVKTKTGDHPETTYNNDKTLCVVNPRQVYSNVMCTSFANFNSITGEVDSAKSKVQQKYGDLGADQTVNYMSTADKSVRGTYWYVSGKVVGDFYVKVGNDDWAYVASSQSSPQTAIGPACSVLQKPEYKNVFESLTSIGYCEK